MSNNLVLNNIGIALLCLLFGIAHGQEEQVAFLPGVFELSEGQRAKANVLNEYKDGFHKALLYKRTDEYLLRIEFQKRTNQRTEDFPISISELDLLRAQLQESLSDIQEMSSIDRPSNGRGYLITSTSLHAIAQSRLLSNLFYREMIYSGPFGSYPHGDRTRFGKAMPYLATAGAITGSILLTRNKHISPAAANMHFWGSLFGYGHGFLIYSMIESPNNNYDDLKARSALMAGTSILEGWLGYQVAKKYNFSYTRTKAINSGNFWGGFGGLMAYGMIVSEVNGSNSGLGFSGLLGSGIGLFGANMLMMKYPRSSGDITAINLAGLVGFSWGSYAAISFDMEGRGAFSSFFIGTMGGLALSGLSTKNTNFSNLEGGLIAVSSLAGGALGLGVANLTEGTEAGYSISAALGLTAGWIISYQLLSRSETRLKSFGFNGKVRWNINPSSIGMVMSSPERQASLMRQNIRMDMVGLNYAF